MNDQLNKLLDIVKKNQPNADCELIIKAYNFAKEAHKDQKRVSGLPYIMHPLSVATIVASMKMDTESIIKSLMEVQTTKKTKVENNKTKHEWKQEKWAELNTKIYNISRE